MTNKMAVLINDLLAGNIAQLRGGKLRFEYHNDYIASNEAVALSQSMPLASSAHNDDAIRPYLWGLLPDNDDTLNQWGKRFGVSPRNPFALIGHVGEDLQGAVQIVSEDRLDELSSRKGATPLSRVVLAEQFAELMRNPGATQFSAEGGQFSLAGAQRKKALYLVNRRWYEPRGRTPTTHILKPAIPGLVGQVENEMFCVRLAPRIGLPAPKCWIERFDGTTVVVIERYDRVRLQGMQRLPIDKSGGIVHRVHQEDCCQALSIDPRNKYQNQGGPGMKQILDLLSSSSRPSLDRDRFMRACAYNFIIGGTDAHGKNYSLLIAAAARFRLAPLYDLGSWLPYSRNRKEDKLAMSVGGKYRLDQIMPRHWEAEARKANYDKARAVGHVRDLLATLPIRARELLDDCEAEDSANSELNRLVSMIFDRCDALKKIYGAEEIAR